MNMKQLKYLDLALSGSKKNNQKKSIGLSPMLNLFFILPHVYDCGNFHHSCIYDHDENDQNYQVLIL